MSRVSELLKGAVELNLRYTSTLLHLSKDYLKDANDVLTRGPSPEPEPPTVDPDEPAPNEPGKPPARPALLIVGRAGETGHAAFAVNNPGEKDMSVHLIVQGELDERVVQVEPARLALKQGEGAIVRILARIDEKLPVNQDLLGSIVAPGLSNQGVPFIVRRLPDASTPAQDASPRASGTDETQAPEATDAPAASTRTRKGGSGKGGH